MLERPEYGYATYFFELVDSTPIDWQIRRLVIAMKLTSYSRVTLIENKKLTVFPLVAMLVFLMMFPYAGLTKFVVALFSLGKGKSSFLLSFA